jgi:membrane protein implicated in regulation of membrane protease activity
MPPVDTPHAKPPWLLIAVLCILAAFLGSGAFRGALGFGSLDLSNTAAGVIAFAIVFTAIYLDTAPARADWWTKRQATRRKAKDLLDRLEKLETRLTGDRRP